MSHHNYISFFYWCKCEDIIINPRKLLCKYNHTGAILMLRNTNLVSLLLENGAQIHDSRVNAIQIAYECNYIDVLVIFAINIGLTKISKMTRYTSCTTDKQKY
jgi:hypothetical protein